MVLSLVYLSPPSRIAQNTHTLDIGTTHSNVGFTSPGWLCGYITSHGLFIAVFGRGLVPLNYLIPVLKRVSGWTVVKQSEGHEARSWAVNLSDMPY